MNSVAGSAAKPANAGGFEHEPLEPASSGAGEVLRQRELLYFLAWRDVKVRYKQAALGVAWALLQPLMTMVTFTFVFGRVAAMPTDGIPYPLFSYSALVLWTYFASTLSQAGNSLVSNSNLITKIYFPRVFLPASSAVGGLLDIAVSSLFLVALMIYYHVGFHWTVLLAPLFVLELVMFVLGVSMVLAALNVRYRDVKYTIPFVTQIWMFLTPIIYPSSYLPEKYRIVMTLNPLTGIIEGFRAAVLGGRGIDWAAAGAAGAVTVAVFAAGLLYFRRTERVFADIV